MKIHNQTLRTFFHSVAVAAAIALGLVTTGRYTLAAGFGIGAAISLFSLFSLKVCIPALFYKGATTQAAALLQVVLMMKLPIYALGLYFATRMGNAAAAAAFVGCTIVPGVIAMESVCRALIQANPQWRRAAAMHGAPAVLPAIETSAAGCETTAAARVPKLHKGAA